MQKLNDLSRCLTPLEPGHHAERRHRDESVELAHLPASCLASSASR